MCWWWVFPYMTHEGVVLAWIRSIKPISLLLITICGGVRHLESQRGPLGRHRACRYLFPLRQHSYGYCDPGFCCSGFYAQDGEVVRHCCWRKKILGCCLQEEGSVEATRLQGLSKSCSRVLCLSYWLLICNCHTSCYWRLCLLEGQLCSTVCCQEFYWLSSISQCWKALQCRNELRNPCVPSVWLMFFHQFLYAPLVSLIRCF